MSWVLSRIRDKVEARDKIRDKIRSLLMTLSDAAVWVGAHPRGALVAICVVGVIGYALSCWWFPFAKCWCCGGRGVHLREDGKVFRDCRWVCKGTGRRRRVGRAVFEWIRRTTRNAA